MGAVFRFATFARTGFVSQVASESANGSEARPRMRLLILFLCSLLPFLSGCGGSVTVEHPAGTLTASPSAILFGNVSVGQAANATVTLRAGDSGSVQITQLSLNGQSFAIGGQSELPITIAAGGVFDLSVEFDPTATGAVAGQVTITSNASEDGPVAIALSGTGTPPSYVVDLSWDAPVDSPVPVVGYNIYRSPAGSSNYQLLNSSVDQYTSYMDNSVQNGLNYDYILESVASSGSTSAPTSPVTVSIP